MSPKRHQDSEAARVELLSLLSTEIARDGGASLVTSLKDYMEGFSSRRLNAVLVLAIGKAKLLSFLESEPEVFEVDRSQSPHWVVLREKQHVVTEKLKKDQSDKIRKTRQILIDKALYMLRKNRAKQERRLRKLEGAHHPESYYKANCRWLLQECKWDLHTLLRDTGFYIRLYDKPDEVRIVGSPSWQELVESEFEEILKANSTSFALDDGKVWLLDSLVPSEEKVESIEEYNPEYLRQLDATLTRLVDQDGATQVNLDLLLHRHRELQNVLGGRDLCKLLRLQQRAGCGQLFQNISVDVSGSDVVLKSKRARDGRMKVDEEGLFSVTNSKWGKAIAKTMIHSLKQIDWGNEAVVAVDLTASVGGMTLGLAKTQRFQRIIAVEIDPTRAELCRQNMVEQKMQDIVEIWTQDSMDAIPSLPPRSCILIDPPFGGANYKQDKANQRHLKMGPWSLEDVVVQVSAHIRPCIVGIRLPVKFLVQDFLASLKQDYGLRFETLSVRKLCVQLFVVLAFHLETN